MTKADTAVTRVAARIAEAVPAHTYVEANTVWTWTTPNGLWRIKLDLVYAATSSHRLMKVTTEHAELSLPVDEPSLELVLGLLRQWGALDVDARRGPAAQ